VRTGLEQAQLPFKSRTAVLHDDAQIIRAARHAHRGELHAGVLDDVAQQFADDLEDQHSQIDADGRILRGHFQIDLQIVFAAHIDAEPLERRLQP
jgi:hypothetical protein